MMITEFLHCLDTQHKDIWFENNDLFIGLNANIKLPELKQEKKAIKLRLLNNQFAKQQGWLVGSFGDVYIYRYSASGYIFIERNPDETVDIYRCKFNLDNKVHQVKNLNQGISFSEAYIKAKHFLDWFYSVNPHLKRK